MIPVSRPSLTSKELRAIGKVIETGWLGMGSSTKEFEEEIKKQIGCKYAIAVNTGTSALHIALDSFGIGDGDEVIVPSLTFVASIQAIISVGAVPVFCESNKDDLLIDIQDVKNKITNKTRAIMPVHYCGQACDMDSLLEISEKYNLWIIEDAAHAFGSTYKKRKIGSFGHATCFSFDPIKVITCGEGGAVVLNDKVKAELIQRKRILGIDSDTHHRYLNKRNWFYNVSSTGYRYHMPNLSAAIGLVQMDKFDKFIKKRRDICRKYDLSFSSCKTITPLKIDYDETVPFMYVVRVHDNLRDELMEFMRENGVETGVHYIPNHLHQYFKKYNRSSLPNSEKSGKEIITLPLYYDMTEDDVKKVTHSIADFDSRKLGY